MRTLQSLYLSRSFLFLKGLSLSITFLVMFFYGTLGYAEMGTLPQEHSMFDHPENELAYHVPGTIRLIKPLKYQRESFIELSGELDEDDPLEDFSAYIIDPITDRCNK